jgi:hypothetical protein
MRSAFAHITFLSAGIVMPRGAAKHSMCLNVDVPEWQVQPKIEAE